MYVRGTKLIRTKTCSKHYLNALTRAEKEARGRELQVSLSQTEGQLWL